MIELQIQRTMETVESWPSTLKTNTLSYDAYGHSRWPNYIVNGNRALVMQTSYVKYGTASLQHLCAHSSYCNTQQQEFYYCEW